VHSTRLIGRALLKMKSATAISIRLGASGSCLVPTRVSWAYVGGGWFAAFHLFLSECDRELVPELQGDSSNGRFRPEESLSAVDRNVAKVLAPAREDVLLKKCTKRNLETMIVGELNLREKQNKKNLTGWLEYHSVLRIKRLPDCH
jgi:hypothetical protein